MVTGVPSDGFDVWEDGEMRARVERDSCEANLRGGNDNYTLNAARHARCAAR